MKRPIVRGGGRIARVCGCVLGRPCIMSASQAGQIPFPHLIQMMVGRDIREAFPKKIVPLGGELLRIEHLSVTGILEDISLSVRAGEIVGMAGLVGSGRTELAKALVGALPMS